MTGNNELSGEWLQSRPGERFSIRVPASATNGNYSVTEILSSPGDSTPAHLHENEDEHILVVEGTARVLYGDKTFDARAGAMVSLARGIPHAWGNPTDTPIRLMITARPRLGRAVWRKCCDRSLQVAINWIHWRFHTNRGRLTKGGIKYANAASSEPSSSSNGRKMPFYGISRLIRYPNPRNSPSLGSNLFTASARIAPAAPSSEGASGDVRR